MTLENIILVTVIAAVLILAAWAIRKSKKKGNPCIGCPNSGCCSGCSRHTTQ